MDMIKNGFGNSAVLSRAANRDLGNSQFVDIVGLDETSRANGSRGGGVRVYSDKELALMTQSKTKFDKIRLEPKRLTGMYFASDEILKNAPLLTGEMNELFSEEFAFKGQDLAINGSGAGEALGVMNAGCLVTVAAEAAQVADTIVFANLAKMKARVRLRNRNSLVWIANQDVEPQLYTLSLPVGTGGSVMPVYTPSTNQADGVGGMLMGIPIIFVEQCATLGDVGDIILGDWSMYYAANKGGLESASSIHLKFDYNQTAFRFVTWFDGQPRMKAAITPYKGSNTVSPFVALATR
jgi:HK97 family phage major capsid protein